MKTRIVTLLSLALASAAVAAGPTRSAVEVRAVRVDSPIVIDGVVSERAYARDFSFKSLRGNAVFRWEYRPGSTLYLVWTQERSDVESTSDFNVGPSFRRLISADADNIFLAKVTYFLNL
jgi:hypothetical protein